MQPFNWQNGQTHNKKLTKYSGRCIGHVGKRLDKIFSKFMTSSTGKQMLTIHILPGISRLKGNKTTKFVPLIEYVRNINLEKSYTKCCG